MTELSPVLGIGTLPGFLQGPAPVCTLTAAQSGNCGLWAYSEANYNGLSWSGIYQQFSALPNDIYCGSAWIRSAPSSLGGTWVVGSKACVRIEFLNINSEVITYYDSDAVTIADSDWIEYSVTTPQSPAGTAQAKYRCYIEKPNDDNPGQSVANFDDCSFEKITLPEAKLSVNPTSLGFGSDLNTLSFDIKNIGGEILSWNITHDPSWISVSPISGTTTTETDTITVEVDRTDLSLFSYHGIIAITSTGGNQDVEVYMETTTTDPVPIQPSIVTTDGYQLMVQKRLPNGSLNIAMPYIIKGAAWSPASIGTTSEYYSRRNEYQNWYRLDIQLMKEMNANMIYVFLDFGTDSTMIDAAIDILDYCYQNGIMVVMTADEDGSDNTANITKVVNAYKNHPAILMWALGNEWNLWRPDRPQYYYHYATLSEASAAMQANALQIKSLDTNHPVCSILGEINYPTQEDVNNIVNNICTAVDVWGANIYRGSEFYALFTEWAGISTKPFYLAEFGTDAFHTTSWWPPVGYEDEIMQANFVHSLWTDLAQELSASNSSKVCLGGTVFEWNDEWWKSNTGDLYVQEPDGYETTWNPAAHPDGFANEEWFGVVDIDRGKRELYYSLQQSFNNYTSVMNWQVYY